MKKEKSKCSLLVGCVGVCLHANLRDFVRACVQAWKHNGMYLFTTQASACVRA